LDIYSGLKLLHIATAMIWAGGLAGVVLLGIVAARASGEELVDAARRAALFERVVVGPAAVSSLAFGATMAWLGWSFLDLWIALALAGFLATFLVDSLIVRSLARRLPMVGEAADDRALAASRGIMRAAGFDVVILFSMLVLMVFKPTSSDIGVLAVLACVVTAGAATLLLPSRQGQ
jgi:uncharacterized membrane protein